MNEEMIAAISIDCPKRDKSWIDAVANASKFISKILNEEALYEDKTVRWEGPIYLDPQKCTLYACYPIEGFYTVDQIRRISQACSGCAVAIDNDLNLEMHEIVKAAIKQRAVKSKEKIMVNLSIRIEAEVLKQITDLADADKRTVSYVGRELILSALNNLPSKQEIK